MTLLFLGTWEALFLLVLVFLIAIPVLVIVLVLRKSKNEQPAVDWQAQAAARAAAEAHAPRELDRVFDGRSAVIYDTRPANAVSALTAIAGAIDRGYTYLHDDGGVLTFQLNVEVPR